MSAVCRRYFLGIDVGTSSVRSALLDQSGRIVRTSVVQLDIHNPTSSYFEQSSEQIWNACLESTKRVVENDLDLLDSIVGVGFDATCSLVVLDSSGKPLSVSPSEYDEDDEVVWDVIMWMDHRASEQADRINATEDERLKSVGGKISLEMQLPKLLWLKENKPDVFQRAAHFMDLVDFLTFKATGSTTRFLTCLRVALFASGYSRTMKQHGAGIKHFFEKLVRSSLYTVADRPQFQCQIRSGLSELCENNFSKIGNNIAVPGSLCGHTRAFGSRTEIPVAVGLIDAHAGCLAILYSKVDDESLSRLAVEQKICLISGTSACHVTLSRQPMFVDGVWGPYYEIVLPEIWVNEAGQNAVGVLLDSVAEQYCRRFVPDTEISAHCWIRDKLDEYVERHGWTESVRLSENVHVWPDYRGNRSPIPSSSTSGAVLGLKLDVDATDLQYALSIYVAHVHALALMSRFILETLTKSGYRFGAIYLCGGLQKNVHYVRAHADVCQLPVILPNDHEPVARGAAMLGAAVSGLFPSLSDTARSLAPTATVVKPEKENEEYFQRKYKIFRNLGQLVADCS